MLHIGRVFGLAEERAAAEHRADSRSNLTKSSLSLSALVVPLLFICGFYASSIKLAPVLNGKEVRLCEVSVLSVSLPMLLKGLPFFLDPPLPRISATECTHQVLGISHDFKDPLPFLTVSFFFV